MKVELEIEDEFDLRQLIMIVENTKDEMEWYEYCFGGSDILYFDLSMLSSVVNQLKEQLND